MASTFKINIAGKVQTVDTLRQATFSDYNQNPVTSQPNTVTDMECIHQSLDNLFHSHKNHRRYMPWYYVPIDALIGELNGTTGADQVLMSIKSYVEMNEPRVKCYPLLSTIENTGEHAVRLDLVLSIQSLQEDMKFTYSTDVKVV